MSQSQGIDYFGRDLPLAQTHIRASLQVRRHMYEWFISQIPHVAGKAFLEHGSTPDTERADSNCFIRWLLQDGARVYATSPEEIGHLEQAFPGLQTVHFPPQPSDVTEVDWIISSAVLEHVGSVHQQIEYVKSLLELSPRVLLTTPNRSHWLEFHTKLPLLHWLPYGWHRAILKVLGLKFWASEQNLRLVSRQELEKILELAAQECHLKLEKRWFQPTFLGMVSNLVVLLYSTD